MLSDDDQITGTARKMHPANRWIWHACSPTDLGVLPVANSLNQARMDHLCTHLHTLLLDPLTTPDFTEPILDVANLQVYGYIITDWHPEWCRSHFVCHGQILVVIALVGGSLTYKSTRLDAKMIYRYNIHTCMYMYTSINSNLCIKRRN